MERSVFLSFDKKDKKKGMMLTMLRIMSVIKDADTYKGDVDYNSPGNA